MKFLDNLESRLEALNEGDIAVYVKGLVDKKTEPDKQLATEVTRNWSEISSGRLQFDRQQAEAAACLDIRKADLIDFWKSIYSVPSSRRALVTQVVPREGPASSAQPAKSTGYAGSANSGRVVLGVDDIQLFRKERDSAV